MALLIACLALFGAGVTSTLSPCVLPLVPGYLGVLADAPARVGRQSRMLAFAAGAMATFVALGGVVATIGLGVSAAVDWSQRIAGGGLIMFGVLMVLGRRGRVLGEIRLIRTLPAQPHLRALLLGVGCGAAWSPCVGPLLGVALTAAGGTGSLARGSILLAAFATGTLTPFVALSLVPPIPTAALVPLGRRLGGLATVITVLFGVVLAAGWYDGLVQRLAW